MLLHICCANCALYPLEKLTADGYEVIGLWFNPNIHPVTEYNARLTTVKRLQLIREFEVVYKDHYGLVEFVRNVAGKESARCAYCYRVRLEETAKTASEMGIDTFSTTLLYSIFQKRDLIVETGHELAKTYRLKFHDEDFRVGWNRGIKISKELNLYRQKYCGCIYSEMERYLGETCRKHRDKKAVSSIE